MKLTLDRETISPKQAAEYLEMNDQNRNLREKLVAKLVGAIKRGEWLETGDPIKFNGERLIDGQHRLAAIARAGRRVPVWVARGVPSEAQEVVDTGAARTPGDMLALRGYSNVNVVAAIARLVWLYRTAGSIVPENNWILPTHQQLLQTVEDESILEERAAWATRFHKQDRALQIGGSLGGALRHLFAELASEEDAQGFFDELLAPRNTTSPPALLRQRLLRASPHTPITRTMRAALIVKAWNAWIAGERPTRLTWRAGGAKKESFPVINGTAE